MSASIRSVLSVAAALGASATISVASAQDYRGPSNVPTTPASVEESSDPNEPRMETEVTRTSFPNRPLLATGAVLLVSGYVPAAIGGALSAREEDEDLYIPVAGPWMTLSKGEKETTGERTLLVADGLVQGVGALAMLTSLMIPERTTKNWYLIGSNDRFRLTTHGLGLGATGRF